MGDLAGYEFRTLQGNKVKIGLITGISAALGDNVWCVLGFDGEEYRIHGDYLYTREEREQ